MIKTHTKTGLKYLCYTRKKDHISYKGSGKKWLEHLKENGETYNTELIFESEYFEDFKNFAVLKSFEYDIVNSDLWANLKIEEGDGGDTVSNRKWITNGVQDKYIVIGYHLEEGWRYGRSNCVFNDKNTQKEFNNRVDQNKKSKSMSLAWETGKMDKRDNSKCGVSGDKNPSKRKEVKEKIKMWQLQKPSEFCEECNKWFKNLSVHKNRSKAHNGNR
jgi:hypothetical protein